jgi:osmoprotectant transport system substrate-binding protein
VGEASGMSLATSTSVGRIVSYLGTAANWSGSSGFLHRLLQHVGYSGATVLIAVAIALPLGLITGHTRRGGSLLTILSNTSRALPTLGLLTIFAVTIGVGLGAAVVPLLLLAIPSILVNTNVGVTSVDPALVDAAYGMGLTSFQVLWQVEIPLAMPLMILGLRTAALQVVSTATITAYVGLGGLGRFIIDGQSSGDFAELGAGAVVVAVFAIATRRSVLSRPACPGIAGCPHSSLGGLTGSKHLPRGPNMRRQWLLIPTVVILASISAWGSSAVASSTVSAVGSTARSGGNPTVTIGSANFPESEVLADIYADALKKAGVKVVTKLDIGTREIYFEEMKNGALNVFPEYNGALLDYLRPSSAASSTGAVDAALGTALPTNLKALQPSPAQDGDSITVTSSLAAADHLSTIADLKPIEAQVTIGAAPQFGTRQQGLAGLKKLYGITLRLKALDQSGPLDVAALNDGSIQASDIFTTDPAVSKYHFVALADPLHLFPAENVIPIVNDSADTPTIAKTLNAVSAALTTDDLVQMVGAVVNDHVDAMTVAASFISQQALS